MSRPSVSTVTIDGNKFDVLTAHISLSTVHDDHGMPMMGSSRLAIECVADMHDEGNLPFSTLSALFQLANVVTRDKIKNIKIEFWRDDSKQDVVCTYTFTGWISNYVTGSGGGGNHTLSLSLQPSLDAKQYSDIQIGN